MRKWASNVKRIIKGEARKSINLAIVCAGFGPGNANIFRKIVGLREAGVIIIIVSNVRISAYAFCVGQYYYSSSHYT
jgi:hypothetical protein